MKIGIYGGTFNPPHLGHQAAAAAALEQLGLDKLFLIPAGQPPHKELPADAATAEQRLEMTRILADLLDPREERVEVLDLELARPGKSYTVDTVEALGEQYPEAELWLLMGTDMFLCLQDWHRAADLLRLVKIAPFGRVAGDADSLFPDQKTMLEQRFGADIRPLDLARPVEISSTELRAALTEGRGEEYLAPSILGYILRHRLYGTAADLKALTLPELRAASYSMIRAKRIPHIRGTEQAAVELAHRWGCDPELARKAAILHDCTKYLDLEEQLSVCAQYGVPLDDLERRAPKLLHSKTGAHIARDNYGMPEAVFEAICWHTTGKADMNTLEKIIYLADYMEPTRDFDGVKRLRQLAEEDLDQAILLGLEMTMDEMRQRGNEIHRNTMEAWEFLKGIRK